MQFQAEVGGMDDAVELADLIWQLRSELTRAMLTGGGKDLRFRAESVELELTLAVEKARDRGVKARFWVMDGNLAAKHTNTVTQKLKLTMRPVLSTAPDESALISGTALENER